jgi:hypothetical protein
MAVDEIAEDLRGNEIYRVVDSKLIIKATPEQVVRWAREMKESCEGTETLHIGMRLIRENAELQDEVLAKLKELKFQRQVIYALSAALIIDSLLLFFFARYHRRVMANRWKV